MVLFLLHISGAWSQSIQFDHLMNHEKLDYTKVYNLYEDPQGFLWVGTDNGAWRYDGFEIKQFGASPSYNITSFHYLKKQIMLAGCDSGLLVIPALGKPYLKYFNTNRPVHITGSLTKDGFWLFTVDKVYYLNENLQTMDVYDLKGTINFQGLNPSGMSSAIASDNTGRCYLIQSGIVYVLEFKNEKIQMKIVTPDVSGKAIQLSGSVSGNLWIQLNQDDHTAWLWNPLNKNRIDLDPIKEWGAYNNVFFVTLNGDVYFSNSDEGLLQFNPKTKRIRKIRSNPYDKRSLSGGTVLHFLEDRNKCLWVATTNGLDQSQALNTEFKYYSFAGFSEQLRYEKPVFYDAVWENDSTCLMTSSSHFGLIQLDLNRGSARFAGRSSDLYVDRPVALIRLKNPLWLVSCVNGNFIYNEESGDFKSALQYSEIPDIFHLKSTVKACFDDDRGNVFISILNHQSVYRYNRISDSWFRYNFSTGTAASGTFPLPSFIAGTKYENEASDVSYFVHENNTDLARYDYTTDHFSAVKFNTGGYTPYFTDIDCDENGNLWLTSEKALFLFNPSGVNRSLYKVNQISDYIKDKSIRQTVILQNGQIWITTDKGLIRYQPAQKQISFFNSADGLSGEELGYCIRYNPTNKQILCTTESGVLYFDPEKIKKNTPELFALITGVEVNGKPLYPNGKHFNLSFDQRNIIVHYTAPCLTSSSAIFFSYLLEGYQQKWSTPSFNRMAEFSQLPAGNYTLRIRSGFDGVTWKEAAVPLQITINKPLYQRPLFIIICVLAGAGLIILWLMEKQKMKLKQILVSQEIRNRISRDLHDDLGSALSSISFISNVGQNADGKKARQYHQLIGNTARGMIDSMNDIVWVVNPKNDSVESMISRMRRFSSTLFEAKGINLRFKEESSFSGITLTMQERRNIYLIFKEIVNNSAKHSACTEAEIVLQRQTWRFGFSISDNGAGFDTEKPYIGNGLSNMKVRAKEIGGILEIRSSPGAGSSFIFHLG
jgi:signal transduction histidine kinase/ligand-binding sensor domain-containing protein